MLDSNHSRQDGGKDGLFVSEEARRAWTFRTMRDFLECRRLHGDRDPSEPPTWDDYEGNEEAQRGLAKSHRIRRMPGSGSIVDPLKAHRLDLEEERQAWLEAVRPHIIRLLSRWKPRQTRDEVFEEIEVTTTDRPQEEFLKAQILKALRFFGAKPRAGELREASLGRFTESLHREITRKIVQDLTNHLDRPDLRKDILIEDHVDQAESERTTEDVLAALVGGTQPVVESPEYQLHELRRAAETQHAHGAQLVLRAIFEADPDEILKESDSPGQRTTWSLNKAALARESGLSRYKVEQALNRIRDEL